MSNDYTLKVDGYTYERRYLSGDTISISAIIPNGYIFKQWKVIQPNSFSLDNVTEPSFNLTMPDSDVVIKSVLEPLANTFAIISFEKENPTSTVKYEYFSDIKYENTLISIDENENEDNSSKIQYWIKKNSLNKFIAVSASFINDIELEDILFGPFNTYQDLLECANEYNLILSKN